MTRPHDAAADGYACADCHQLLPRAAFAKHARGLFGLNAACRQCMRVKSQKRWAETREKQRAARSALAPVAVTPKPEPKPTTPDSVRYRSAKPIVYPTDPIEQCVFPGVSCEAQAGFALAHDLFSSNTCGGVYRGYFATVGKEATGMVYPRFARVASRDLRNSMVKSRYGVTDERRAAA